MKRLVVELTDRCNLRCAHCYSGRHGAKHELDLPAFLALLPEARRHGVSEVCFTGGEPTLYSRFAEAVDATVAAGFTFGLVSNGWGFERPSEVILRNRAAFTGITFSMDGATEAVHDRQRGSHSYRRLMASIARCRELALVFTLNFVVTARSRHEIAAAATLAADLGAAGIRFISFIPTDQADFEALDLPLAEWDVVLAELLALRKSSPVAIGISPGFPSAELLPCHSLAGAELNLDWQGQLGLCCHLSGVTPSPKTSKLADLERKNSASSFTAMHAALEVQRSQLVKRRLLALSQPGLALKGQDRLACRDCMQQLHLLPVAPSVASFPQNPDHRHAMEAQ